MLSGADYRIGTAGWVIPGRLAAEFPTAGSHLERYAALFRATEINSSFYKPHRPQTYARWASSVPSDFRFAVKVPREVTHMRKLVGAEELLDRFLGDIHGLGEKLGPLLVQLPPSLGYVEATARSFFDAIRARYEGDVVCEPRHASWFGEDAGAALHNARIARVAADPACVPAAAVPGGWTGLTYCRLHGSPRMYSSPYSPGEIERIAAEMSASVTGGRPSWCMFDNTMHGEAARNAAELVSAVGS